jgi:hypothetical protein
LLTRTTPGRDSYNAPDRTCRRATASALRQNPESQNRKSEKLAQGHVTSGGSALGGLPPGRPLRPCRRPPCPGHAHAPARRGRPTWPSSSRGLGHDPGARPEGRTAAADAGASCDPGHGLRAGDPGRGAAARGGGVNRRTDHDHPPGVSPSRRPARGRDGVSCGAGRRRGFVRNRHPHREENHVRAGRPDSQL